jgi:hypothetical protein
VNILLTTEARAGCIVESMRMPIPDDCSMWFAVVNANTRQNVDNDATTRAKSLYLSVPSTSL